MTIQLDGAVSDEKGRKVAIAIQLDGTMSGVIQIVIRKVCSYTESRRLNSSSADMQTVGSYTAYLSHRILVTISLHFFRIYRN
jgi:hypothetical protein